LSAEKTVTKRLAPEKMRLLLAFLTIFGTIENEKVVFFVEQPFGGSGE
jgi:hypothetical protein